ncbi:MAG TPA: response regulator transcription factor [Bacteroidales bacterium]|jgi:DNA-binding NarL/FixJ family response regulator|nr:response regulator transcription factor [Bacteroidales bacterium]
MPKALIVEDHPIVSDSLTNLIHTSVPGLECYHVTTAHDGLAWLNGNKAAIILLDINLPDMSGIEFGSIVRSRFRDLNILAITSIEQRHVVDHALAAGINGYILKSSDTDEILEAITQVMNGNKFISKSVAELLKGKPNANADLPVLTRREVEVLKLIADGLTNQEIADKLFISAWTVDSHRKNLLLKFNAKNTAILVKTAVTSGIISF